MKKQLPISVILLTLCFAGCGKKEEDSLVSEDSAIADSVEAGITAMAGASDDQSGASLASMERTKIDYLFEKLNPIPSAYASVCLGRAVGQTCNSGVKSISYSSCTIAASAQTLSGTVDLTYSDSTNCDIDTTGEYVTRTYDYMRTTGFGATIKTFSSSKTDYAGNSYGGGAKLTKTASGYELEIMGKHKERTSARGRSRLDLSIRTTENVSFDNLNRANRTISGGTLEIAHNLAKYTMKLEPNNVVYDSSCCYPVGGSVDVTYSGSISGTGTVTFTSCGEATVSKGAESYNIEFYSCE